MSGDPVERRARCLDAAVALVAAAVAHGRAHPAHPLGHQVLATAAVLEAWVATGQLPDGVEPGGVAVPPAGGDLVGRWDPPPVPRATPPDVSRPATSGV